MNIIFDSLPELVIMTVTTMAIVTVTTAVITQQTSKQVINLHTFFFILMVRVWIHTMYVIYYSKHDNNLSNSTLVIVIQKYLILYSIVIQTCLISIIMWSLQKQEIRFYNDKEKDFKKQREMHMIKLANYHSLMRTNPKKQQMTYNKATLNSFDLFRVQ